MGEEARAAELRERCAGLFARFGIKTLNMDDLAKHLACSKKTLYKHFRDKRDLVSQALTSHLDGLEKRMDEVMSSQGNAIDVALQEMEEKRSMLSAMNPTVLFDLKKHYPKVFEATFSRRRAMVRRVVKHNVHRGMEEGLYRFGFERGCGGRFALGPGGGHGEAGGRRHVGPPAGGTFSSPVHLPHPWHCESAGTGSFGTKTQGSTMKILSMNAAAIGLAWCTLLVAPTAGSAQTSLSLAEAQDKALDQAYAMERALIDVEVAKRDVKELLATGLPQVTGSVDFNHFIDILTQVVPRRRLTLRHRKTWCWSFRSEPPSR